MNKLFKKFKEFEHYKAIALMAVALLLLVMSVVFYLTYMPVHAGNMPKKVVIEEGQGLRSIAQTLKENSLIRNEFIFTAFVELSGHGNDLKAGRYNFSGRLNVPDVVFVLVNGLAESDDIRLLISEGFNIWEIDRRLTELELIEEGEFSLIYYDEEGYLFPDTYRINDKSRGPDFIQELRERMEDNFNNKTADVLGGLSFAESREVIIIASILEKEARAEKDMKLVSGIIKNRMKLGMSLQVDATVIYGACWRKATESNFTKNCDVTFQGPATEIKIDGPYNSYTRKGLPPGPISNPGFRAIDAALNPTESDFLFYLSTRDGSQMIYSKTPAEHVTNRKKYLGI